MVYFKRYSECIWWCCTVTCFVRFLLSFLIATFWMLKKGRRFLSEPKEEALIWFPFALSLYRHLDPFFYCLIQLLTWCTFLVSSAPSPICIKKSLVLIKRDTSFNLFLPALKVLFRKIIYFLNIALQILSRRVWGCDISNYACNLQVLYSLILKRCRIFFVLFSW